MKKALFLGIGILFGFAGTVFAHPPTDIQLTYDRQVQNLHVEMVHVSHNLNKHRIRLITVFINDQEVKKLSYSSQSAPHKVIQDIPLKTNVGEKITIKAICSQAGSGTQSLTVPGANSRTQANKKSSQKR